MRKLVFLVALFCCSTQAMAADPCADLQGKSLSINGNGFKGVIGPNGINLVNQNNKFTFQTTANFVNEPVDGVTGECKDRRIQFTRTRQGANPFTQKYDGWIFEKDTTRAAGTFAHNAPVHYWGWFAEVKSVGNSPLSCKAVCDKENQDCHEIADSSQEHAACTADHKACIDKCP